MINRWLIFATLMMVGGLLGWLVSSSSGATFGTVTGGFLWLALDSFYMSRTQRWLQLEKSNETPLQMLVPLPKLRGVWSEIADKTRRILKNREEQLRESQARLDEFLSAIQASPGGVVLLDSRGRIEWCNQMATVHFGFDAQRDLMQQIENLVREPAFKAYMALGDFSQDVVIPGSASTPTRPVKLSVHLHAYGKDRKLLLSRDITAVELADAMRRDFVANVSHEIRTPLTVLSGFIETLQTLTLKPSERTRFLELMAKQSERMQTLVDDLLTLSKLEGSPIPSVQDWTSVSVLMAQCEQEARALSGLLAPNGHVMTFDKETTADLAGVQTELYSAMSNLVSNAVRYTPEAGSIVVSWTMLSDGRGEFKVKDSGPGIAPEHLPRLTERFYRVDGSRSRATGGTGLGLAIVKHVSQRHGAELRIESKPGRGASFSITFPAVRVRVADVVSSAASN